MSAVWDKIFPGLRSELDAPNSLQLLLPRPVLVVNGAEDLRCPLAGLAIMLYGTAVNGSMTDAALAGVQAALETVREETGKTIGLYAAEGVGHDISAAMWDAIDTFLVEHLARGGGSQHAPHGATTAHAQGPERRDL